MCFLFSGSDPNWGSEGWSSLRLELETPAFSYHLISLPCESPAKPHSFYEGHASVFEGSRKASPSRSAFPILRQLLQRWATSSFLIRTV